MNDSSNEYTKSMGEIYKHFSQINVNEHLEKKGGLDFLQWARAVKLVKQEDPDFKFEFKVIQGRGVAKYPSDGEGYNCTAEVICTINCYGHEFDMWLPVMDFKNKAIINPDSRAINDAKIKSEEAASEEMKNITGGISLPPGFKLPF